MTRGFTVGCWDLFHMGHYNFLQRAASRCDALAVGIMNDYWCAAQKGGDRPANALDQRIVALKESGFATDIIVLDTLDMTHYLRHMDLWFKGPDQNRMTPAQFENTVIIPRTPGISTTQLLRRNG